MSVHDNRNGDGGEYDVRDGRGPDGRDIVLDERPTRFHFTYNDGNGMEWFCVYDMVDPGNGVRIDSESTVKVRQ